MRLVALFTLLLISTLATASEQFERGVDEAALSSQQNAISKLTGLLHHYRGKPQEPILLLKLADLQDQRSAILFRTAHGAAQMHGGTIDLSRYKRSLNETISTLSSLMAKYPAYVEIPRAFFMRGHCHEELQEKAAATRDYLHLVQHFPEAEDVTTAYMSLAEFATDAGNHPQAAEYLREVEKHPDDPHYPFALYKLAWSHYNTKEIPKALAYAEKQLDYYSHLGDLTQSDASVRENTLMDIPVFFFEGYEEGKPQYKLDETLSYFKKVDSAKILGRMLVRYTKLLRSHGYENDLIAWKTQIVSDQPKLPESLEVVIVVYEYQQGKRKFGDMVKTAQDMITLAPTHPGDLLVKAQKTILDSAEELQSVIVKNKDADEVASYSPHLAAIYDAFTRIVDEADPRIPRVHYNLAETLFSIKDFEGAATHYRWVVEHGSWREKDSVVPQASLRAIASRYELLTKEGLIPKELKTRPLSQDSDRTPPDLLKQWVTWVDEHAKRREEKDGDRFLVFSFDASRALYAQGRVKDAMSRLEDLADHWPLSRYAIPSASLVVDTLIASEDWERTEDMAHHFLSVKEWNPKQAGKEDPFLPKLHAVAADAAYKQIEIVAHSKDDNSNSKLQKMAKRWLDNYSESAHKGDLFALAASSALTAGDHEVAMKYLSRLIAETPKANGYSSALLQRASLHEEALTSSEATADYLLYLNLKPANVSEKDFSALRKKALMLGWASGKSLETVLATPAVCATEQEACDTYRVLAKATSPKPSDGDVSDEIESARKGPERTRALWAMVALQKSDELSFRDRNYAIRTAAGGWNDLEPTARLAAIRTLSDLIPKALAQSRQAIEKTAVLKADPKYITRRVEVIREFENAASSAAKLPWNRIRSTALNETASAYLELARGLSALPPPKGMAEKEQQEYEDTVRKLTLPFEEKAQDIRARAFESAASNAVDDETLEAIAKPYFADNPSQAKTWTTKARAKVENPADGPQSWVDTSPQWEAALKSQEPARIAYLLQRPHTKALEAAALIALGARSEGLATAFESRDDLTGRTKTRALEWLATAFGHSYSWAREGTLRAELSPTAADLNRGVASTGGDAKSGSAKRKQ